MCLERECLILMMYMGAGLGSNRGVVVGESVRVCGCVFVFLFVGLYWCGHFFGYRCC